MKKHLLLLLTHCLFLSAFSQTTQSLVKEVSLDSLVKTVREFSGEDSATFNDTTVRIVHRVSRKNNNLAADYLVHRLEAYGLQVETIDYRSGGRNVIGTMLGKTNPDSIVIISAHYDAVANYCADDNASGSATVLEAARIMTPYCFHNTIKFVFWDEEERGLIGSRYYADTANARGDRIMAVLNMDMMAYDGNSDKVFDIHTNSNPENRRLKDTILSLLDTLQIDLIPKVINPGTTRSDHASFWRHRYPAVFCGESFIGGDPNPAYHTSKDRIDLFDMEYYHKLAKLAIGLTIEMTGAIKTVVEHDTISACFEYAYRDTVFKESTVYRDHLISSIGCDSVYEMDLTITTINDSIKRNAIGLNALDTASTYQWVRCIGNSRIPMYNQNKKAFRVPLDDFYAVILNNQGCTDTSDCVLVTLTDIEKLHLAVAKLYPNPTSDFVTIELFDVVDEATIYVRNSTNQLVVQTHCYNQKVNQVELPGADGIYFIQVVTSMGASTYRVIKKAD